MKKILSICLCIIMIFSIFALEVNAEEDKFVPYVLDFSITFETTENYVTDDTVRASGLIYSYSLYLTKTGNTLNITGQTHGFADVIKSGFKDLTVQRRKTSDDTWKDYYEYGNVYVDSVGANLNTTLVVESGYQYRISCKHYAKKNIISVETIANTSNIVTVS